MAIDIIVKYKILSVLLLILILYNQLSIERRTVRVVVSVLRSFV